MAKIDFSKPLSSTDLIDLLPELLEALNITEPREGFRYYVIEPELLTQEKEQDIVESIGFEKWINPVDAQADLEESQQDLENAKADLATAQQGGKKINIKVVLDRLRDAEDDLREMQANIRAANMQLTTVGLLRKHGLVFAESPLPEYHVLRQPEFGLEKEYIIYVVRQPGPSRYEEHLAYLSGLSPDDICLRYPPKTGNIEIQFSNIMMLGRLAESMIRKIRPDGTTYRGEVCPEDDRQICTRAVLAAEQVWRKQYGNMDVFIAYSGAHIMASLTKMENDRNLDFEYGHLDEALVEKTRQHIAYSLITDLCDFNGKQPDPAHLAAPREVPVQEMIKNATRLLDYVVHEHFDGDVSAHKEAIGVFTRFAEGRATDLDKVAMEVSGLNNRMEELLTLSMLVKIVDGYDSICADACEAQCRASPIVVVRALHHVNEYYKAAFDNTPPKVDPAAIPSVLGCRPAQPPDRSMKRLRRAKRDGSSLH